MHVMHQTWDSLLFLHWAVEPAVLRPLLPPALTLDTFAGKAWLTLSPFTVRNAGPPGLPGLSFHETNVRTYVSCQGVPGIWFFSLDATSRLTVRGARAVYRTPYYDAVIGLRQQGARLDYGLRRKADPRLGLRASWEVHGPARLTTPGTRKAFLMERYCLYAAPPLLRACIRHRPWRIRPVRLHNLETTLLLGLPLGEPTCYWAADPVYVRVWLPKEVSRNTGDPGMAGRGTAIRPAGILNV